MKKKIITSLATIGLVSALVGGATFAYFNATASNSDNLFTAGLIQLSAGGTVTVSDFDKTNLKPGDTGTDTVILSNDLSTLNSDVTMAVAVGNVDSAAGDGGDMAAVMKVTGFTVNGTSVSVSGLDANADGDVTFAELNGQTLDLGEFPGVANSTKDVAISWEFIDTGVEQNDLQGDTVDVDLSFEAMQQ